MTNAAAIPSYSSLLISLSALLVDSIASTKQYTAQESVQSEVSSSRLIYCILLWLTASLQNDILSIYTQTVFTAIIFYIVASSFAFDYYFLQSIAPTCWVSSWLVPLTTTNQPVLGVLTIYTIITVLYWQQRIRGTLSQRRVTSVDPEFLDESRWWTWNAAQTRAWMQQVVRNSDLGHTGNIQGYHIPVLVRKPTLLLELVAGTASALDLLTAMERLLEDYPVSPNNGWLAQHDQEYNAASTNARFSSQKYTTDNVKVVPEEIPDYSHLQSIMKERYGLELPTMQENHPASSAGANEPLVKTNATPAPNEEPDESPPTPALDPVLLDNMPPHIAAICRQKPHLVQQILQSRQISQQENNDDNNDNEQTQLLPLPESPNYRSIQKSPVGLKSNFDE